MKLKDLARRKGLLAAFACGAVFGGSMVALRHAPWADALAPLRERREQDEALAPLIEQARSWSLDYENVAKGAAANAGKPVMWCVDHPALGDSFVGDNASWKVRWTDEAAVPLIQDTKHGCQDMVAVVRGADASGVLLEFKGQP